MLTKEGCENALTNILCNIGVARSDYRTSGKAKEDYHTLKSLIEEHFDNPPLKFEEIKKGMWVCVNGTCWEKVYGTAYDIIFESNVVYVCENGYDFYGGTLSYEHNKFYRKEVVQE